MLQPPPPLLLLVLLLMTSTLGAYFSCHARVLLVAAAGVDCRTPQSLLMCALQPRKCETASSTTTMVTMATTTMATTML
jgi:hypothetical protein